MEAWIRRSQGRGYREGRVSAGGGGGPHLYGSPLFLPDSPGQRPGAQILSHDRRAMGARAGHCHSRESLGGTARGAARRGLGLGLTAAWVYHLGQSVSLSGPQWSRPSNGPENGL